LKCPDCDVESIFITYVTVGQRKGGSSTRLAQYKCPKCEQIFEKRR
jgi:transposase-like protein